MEGYQTFWQAQHNTHNRDQLSKALLYLSKLVSVYLSRLNRHDSSLRFQLLSSKLDDSRKLFRLFKSLHEVRNIKQTYYDSENKDKINKFLDMCIYRCYFSYWLFDNVAILVKYFILKHNRQDQPYYNGLA